MSKTTRIERVEATDPNLSIYGTNHINFGERER